MMHTGCEKEYVASENRYSDMKYRRCGKSGLMLPEISLGLWQNFGDDVSLATSKEMVYTAFDLGITHFDLANNYGKPFGSAEKKFGQILKDGFSKYRDEIVISTKAGWEMWNGPYGDHGSRKYLTASLDQSLKRLGVDYVDIYYSHREDNETPLEETMGALDLAVRSGKALYVGISQYSPENTKKASEILKKMGTPFIIHQPSYNMLSRQIENNLSDVLEEEGIGCIAFNVLNQGLLSGKYLNNVPEICRFNNEKTTCPNDFLSQENLSKIVDLNEIAKERSQTLSQLAISWVLRNKWITSALVGARTTQQIKENVLALNNLSFTDEQLNKIDEILKR